MDLATYSQELAEAATEAAAWVERNEDIVRNEREGLLKELRHARRTFRACQKAASRKMCAGVFGPSQAGKSYLISALARGQGNELMAKFGSEYSDFISEINPEGGKESTGLVTRFTLTEPENLPPDFPVQTRLLSETDLVKIIANAYYADCDHSEDPQSNIEQTLEKLKTRAQNPGTGISLDDLEEIQEYLAKEFSSESRVRELKKIYWDEALKLGQRLDLEGRIQLYALIWDNIEEFTSLLRKLLSALEKLNFPDQLFCAMDALIPRNESIIDVATLKNLGNPNDNRVKVCTPDGIRAEIPKAILTALTAELTIVMRDKPADYFEHTDLLDFPGYRSRYSLEDVAKELKKNPNMLQELFLRGKVAYLFQRYCAERELNSMLLCIGPGNQEVQDLPDVISDWISATHGATPEERNGKPVSLFFILTKFDMEFEDKKGAPSLQTRWDNRLKASLLDFFGKQRDWPVKWSPDHGFNNIFMLRNPNFKFDSVLSFDQDVETGIRPERAQFVESLHNAFLGSSLVNEHFQNPKTAWEEAMRLNDGGISYIRKSLSPMCDPAIKNRQLLENINACREAAARRLRPFYHTDDQEEKRKQKGVMTFALLKKYKESDAFRKRLGLLMRDLTINCADLYDLYPEAARRYREGEENREQETRETAYNPDNFNLDDLKKLMNEVKTISVTDAREQAPENDEAAFYAAYIENKWVERLHQLADDKDFQKYYQLTAPEFSFLASELATGAARLGLRETLAEKFRNAAAYANTRKELIARKQSAIAAAELNDYINWLGAKPGSQKDKQDGKETFSQHPEVAGIPRLAESGANFTSVWLGEWLNALANLIMANAYFDGNQTINGEENTALGDILKRFDPKLKPGFQK